MESIRAVNYGNFHSFFVKMTHRSKNNTIYHFHSTSLYHATISAYIFDQCSENWNAAWRCRRRLIRLLYYQLNVWATMGQNCTRRALFYVPRVHNWPIVAFTLIKKWNTWVLLVILSKQFLGWSKLFFYFKFEYLKTQMSMRLINFF